MEDVVCLLFFIILNQVALSMGHISKIKWWYMTVAFSFEQVRFKQDFYSFRNERIGLIMFDLRKLFDLKFINSEKATKFCEISTLLLTGTT